MIKSDFMSDFLKQLKNYFSINKLIIKKCSKFEIPVFKI